MKKFRILPLIAIATLTGITLPLVSCKKGGGDTPEEEYDIIDETTDEHIEITPTKFKLNERLVISYTIDDENYDIDRTLSIITVGQKVWQASDLEQEDKSVILSADKVNNNTITVKFVSLDLRNSPLCFTDASNDDVGSTVSYKLGSDFDRESIHIQTLVNGEDWKDWNGDSITLINGQSIYVRNTTETLSTGAGESDQFMFCMTGKIKASGNVDSMINYSEIKHCCYCSLFSNCDSLVTAPVLPSTILNNYCYHKMFYNCSSLISTPELPASSLAYCCYYQMFQGCGSLKNAPDLPATTAEAGCYQEMFRDCVSLEQTPHILATSFGNHCCRNMFYDCTKLNVGNDWFVQNIFNKPLMGFSLYWATGMFGGTTYKNECPFTLPNSSEYELQPYCFSGLNSFLNITQIPNNYLPWTNLVENCYNGMFEHCTFLQQTTELPATALADHCYDGMFYQCGSLTNIIKFQPELLAEGCCSWMFAECSSLTQVPELPEVELAKVCYYYMFARCKLLQIKEQDNHETCSNINGDHFIFKCPDTASISRPVDDMFSDTKGVEGSFTPKAGYSYYWVDPE